MVREIFTFCENYVPYYPIPRLQIIQRLHEKIMEEQFAKCPDDSGNFLKSLIIPLTPYSGPSRMKTVKIDRVIALLGKVKDNTSGEMCRHQRFDDG